MQVLAAAAFLAAGSAKLLGVPMMIDIFAQIGVGQWFRYLTGGIEVGAALMLLWPRTIPFGAMLLAATMLGAIGAHLFVLHSSPMAATVLLLVVLGIVWLRRGQLTATLRAA